MNLMIIQQYIRLLKILIIYVNYYFNGDIILEEDWINSNNAVTNKINYFYNEEKNKTIRQ